MLYLPARGGANKANRALLEALAARGHQCHVLAPATGRQGLHSAEELLRELTERRLAFVDAPAVVRFECAGVRVQALKNPAQGPVRAAEEIGRFQPAVTLVSSCLQLAPVLEQRGTRTIYLAHSPWELPFGPGHALDGAGAAELIRRADGIVTVSEDLRRRLREGCGRESAVLRFPVYGPGPFPSLGHPGNAFVLLVNPCAYKGISILVELARRLPRVRFAAVPGWGTTAADLALLRQLANVTIIPPCDNVARILKQTRVLLMPSLWPEGFGQMTVEAMAHGIPVIASDSGGLPEAKLGIDYVLPVRPIRHYESACDEKGLLIPVVPRQDIDPWVEALQRLLADAHHYLRLSQESRVAALHFISGITVAPFAEYFETVVRTARTSATCSVQADTSDPGADQLLAAVSRLSSARRALLAARLTEAPIRTAGRPPLLPLPRQPGGNRFPLSFAQQRLWFVEQLEPAGAWYRPPQTIRIRGRLDVTVLERSIGAVIRRHEILRTSFPLVGDEPVQQIVPALPVHLDIIDLRHHEQPPRALTQGIEQEARAPFDLAHGPLLRAKLLQLDEDEHVLALSIHHLVSDGWSLGIFFRELAHFYNSSLRGEPARLPELPVQYADFAVWQREYLTGRTLEAQLAYWREQLGVQVPALELPTDRSRPPVQTYAGASLQADLAGPLADKLRVLGEREGATLFMVLLAAFQVLLHRWSGQEQIVVGSPIANRNYREIEDLIGFFVNTLALRTDLSGNPPFRELLGRVRRVALGAYAHQDLPFEKLVEELHPERDLSRGPLFQVFFNMLNYDDERLDLDALATEMLEFPKKEAKFDLSLYAREHGAEIRLGLVYNTDLFDEPRMVEMLDQLALLLGEIVENPDERILHFALVTSRARSVLPDPALALREEPAEVIHGPFRRSVQQSPNATVIMDRQGSVSYAELDSGSSRIANALVAAGVRPGDLVALYADRSAALVAAVLGVLKSGAAFTLLDPAFPVLRLAAQIRAAKPGACLTATATGVRPVEFDEVLGSIPRRLEIPVCLAEAAEVLRGHDAKDPDVPVGPDDPAYVAFTSGSTGPGPKAILATHRPLAHFLRWHCRTFGLEASDRFSMLSGLSHDPLLRDVFTPLWLGATLCVPGPGDLSHPPDLLRWMREARITIAHITPALAEMLAAETEEGAANSLPCLRYVFFGGDRLTAQCVARLRAIAPHATCVNFYGTTETPQAAGCYLVPAGPLHPMQDPARTLPVGRGIDGVQLLVLNRADQPAGTGELGEICVRTPYLSRGYINDAELTAGKFVRNPCTAEPQDRLYHTGDLGRYHPDGAVEFHGRADRQVKIRGFRIEPAEIEAALMSHERINQAVVTVVEDDHAGPSLVAYTVCRETVGALSLRGYLRRLLPDYMIPARFLTLDAIPLTPNGKVDYGRLPYVGRGGNERRDFEPPSTPFERRIASIWAQVLGVERVGVRDNFFDMGGHSLMVVKAVAQIEKTMGIRVSLREFFGQTLGQFAAGCEQALGMQAGGYVRP